MLSAIKALSTPPSVHSKVFKALSSTSIYFQAQVSGLGLRLCAFTCRGLSGSESTIEYRKRTKHIDRNLRGSGVQLLTV